MYDPLSTSSAAAFAESSTAPPWPTTPHSPQTLNAPLARKVPSLDKLHDTNGRQPQIYGQPTPGLISPETSTFSNGSKLVKSEPYLRVRITGLDRNRRDILIRFDAQVRMRSLAPLRVSFTTFHRQVCQTSTAQHIGTYLDHMWNANVSRNKLYTTTHRQSFPLYHWPRRRPPLMKKV